MIRKILQIGDPILEKQSKEIKDVKDAEVQQLIADLVETCISKEDITAGLSAPQIGVNSCVIICRRMDLEEETEKFIPNDILWEVMINPRILNSSKKTSSYWEGCLSIGEYPEGLFGPVNRPDQVEISYLNREGKAMNLKCQGFFAHIVQHEIDHLNGVLFLKYIDDPSLIWKSKDLDKYYDDNGEYPPV